MLCASAFDPTIIGLRRKNFHSCSLAEAMKESNFTGFTHASHSECGIFLEWMEIHLKGREGGMCPAIAFCIW